MAHYVFDEQVLKLRLKVVPRSSQDHIAGLLGDALKVTITAPPVDNKANAHLVRWFARLCNVPKSHVQIVAGHQSRTKTIAIQHPQKIPPEFHVDKPTAP